jgi:hypothetical protein
VPCPWLDCKDCNLTPRATNLVLSGPASIPRAHPIGCNYALAQWPSVEIEELKSWASALNQENVRLVGGEKPISACVWSVYLLLTLHHNCLHSNLARATIRDDIEARDGITHWRSALMQIASITSIIFAKPQPLTAAAENISSVCKQHGQENFAQVVCPLQFPKAACWMGEEKPINHSISWRSTPALVLSSLGHNMHCYALLCAMHCYALLCYRHDSCNFSTFFDCTALELLGANFTPVLFTMLEHFSSVPGSPVWR